MQRMTPTALGAARRAALVFAPVPFRYGSGATLAVPAGDTQARIGDPLFLGTITGGGVDSTDRRIHGLPDIGAFQRRPRT